MAPRQDGDKREKPPPSPSDGPDPPKVPKQWLVNICAAVLKDVFKDWVTEQVEDRNAYMADKKEVMIAMDQQMAAKFAASSHFSSK